jgi:hypothetical protein
MSGEKDVGNLFKRVTALELEQADYDQTVTRIIKNYAALGISVKITYDLHQYRICGDTNPLFGAVTASNSYL